MISCGIPGCGTIGELLHLKCDQSDLRCTILHTASSLASDVSRSIFGRCQISCLENSASPRAIVDKIDIEQTPRTMPISLNRTSPNAIMFSNSMSIDPAAWQTLYFIFIALAPCTATQPCSRILGMLQNYTMYLRTSPIFCMADALFILLFPLFTSCCTKRSLKALFHDLLRARFDEEEQETSNTDDVKHQAWDYGAYTDIMLPGMFVVYNILGPVV